MALTADYVRPYDQARSASRTVWGERWRRPLLILVGIELAVLFAPTVAWLVDRWTISVWHNAHGMFIPPLVGWLAWQELRARPDLPVEGSRWGYALLVPALLVHALDAGMHTQLLSAIALFAAIPGLSLLLLGPARTRAIAFPLAFLAFALPIPLGVTGSMHLVLRNIAANLTAALLPVFGVSVFLEGTSIHTTKGVLQVADACSGFSTLYAAMAVATLTAYTAASWPRRLLVLAAAAPLAILANLLRVVALSLLVVWYGSGVLETVIHPLSGMATFALALPVIFWLGGSAPGASSR